MKKIQLTIPKPCHENWDTMTPEDRGRFCGSCQKTVIDFSTMSDRQIAEFFKKPAGSVCGRFQQDQLNREMDVPRKRLPWIKYFFTIALPAFFFAKKSMAQGEIRQTLGKVAMCSKPLFNTKPVKKQETHLLNTSRLDDVTVGFVYNLKKETTKTFTGRVVDRNGEPLPFARIFLPGEGQTLASDSAGKFTIKYKSLPVLVEAAYVGYQPQKSLYKGEQEFKICLEQAISTGLVVTVVRKKNQPIPLIQSKKTDPTFSAFSVYPNPVSSNGNLTIDPKTIEAGQHQVSIISSSGATVHNQIVMFGKENAKPMIALPNLKTGVYFVRLTNTTNGKASTERIVVQ